MAEDIFGKGERLCGWVLSDGLAVASDRYLRPSPKLDIQLKKYTLRFSEFHSRLKATMRNKISAVVATPARQILPSYRPIERFDELEAHKTIDCLHLRNY